MILRDEEWLSSFRWSLLIVDEAHRLKNRHSVLFSSLLRAFRISRRLLLTGTPIQNSVEEFLALVHFANPQLFFDIDALEAHFRPLHWHAVTQEGRLDAPQTDLLAQQLQALSQSFLLRRLKSHVLPDSLPPKRELVLYASLSPMQRQFYRNLLVSNRVSLSAAMEAAQCSDDDPADEAQKEEDQEEEEKKKKKKKKKIQQPKGQSLQNIVVQLRKTCNHPYLFDDAEPTFDGEYVLGDHILHNSTKLMLLDRVLRRLRARGHRVLLYAQMTRMLDILQDYLAWRSYPYERLDGSTRAAERFASVQRFCEDEECFVFLLSTRAGGQGLNLVAADVVIFYDLDWNPCVDQQAEARVHLSLIHI